MNWKKVLCYSGSITLFFIYLFVFSKGFFPEVCKEYKMYYIDDILMDWPGYGGLKYEPGTKLYFGNNFEDKVTSRGQGWGNRENEACWTLGEYASVYFDISEDIKKNNSSSYILRLEMLNSVSDAVVKVNGNVIGKILSGDKAFIEQIPLEAIQDGMLEIGFEIDSPVRPCDVTDSKDTRLLGLMLKSISVDKNDYRIGEIIYLAKNNTSYIPALGAGWSHLEAEACWTIGNSSMIYFGIGNEIDATKKYVLNLEYISCLAEKVDIYVNGMFLVTIDKNKKMLEKELCREMLDKDNITVEFRITKPVQPCTVSESTDSRYLGIMVKSISITEDN